MLNYQGVEVSDDQIQAFRNALQGNWDESLKQGVKEWNEKLLEITEGRKSLYDSKTKERTFFYSWCGDWVSYHLARTGCRHNCLNRKEVNNEWHPGLNLNLLRVWAGDEATKGWSPRWLKDRVEADKSAGDSWHPWDNSRDVCQDGYEPKPGDLVICPRKGGDHIEFWVGREGHIVTVSAGAQAGGVAALKQRDMAVSEFVGIIGIDKLVTSEPF